MSDRNGSRSWIDFLSEEDLSFVRRFILASGSLKKMAEVYSVTYPTIRLRLDRLIQKLQVVDEQQEYSHFERVARAQYVDGRMDMATLRTLLAAHQSDLESNNHGTSESE